ncbi:hypothetical protein [Arenimonas soli]|nr:hypothetical protein [Arenimonas soli]
MKVHAIGLATSANMLNRTFTTEDLIDSSEFVIHSEDDYYIRSFVAKLEASPMVEPCVLDEAKKWVVELRTRERKLTYISDGKHVSTPSGACREAPGKGSLDVLDYL